MQILPLNELYSLINTDQLSCEDVDSLSQYECLSLLQSLSKSTVHSDVKSRLVYLMEDPTIRQIKLSTIFERRMYNPDFMHSSDLKENLFSIRTCYLTTENIVKLPNNELSNWLKFYDADATFSRNLINHNIDLQGYLRHHLVFIPTFELHIDRINTSIDMSIYKNKQSLNSLRDIQERLNLPQERLDLQLSHSYNKDEYLQSYAIFRRISNSKLPHSSSRVCFKKMKSLLYSTICQSTEGELLDNLLETDLYSMYLPLASFHKLIFTSYFYTVVSAIMNDNRPDGIYYCTTGKLSMRDILLYSINESYWLGKRTNDLMSRNDQRLKIGFMFYRKENRSLLITLITTLQQETVSTLIFNEISLFHSNIRKSVILDRVLLEDSFKSIIAFIDLVQARYHFLIDRATTTQDLNYTFPVKHLVNFMNTDISSIVSRLTEFHLILSNIHSVNTSIDDQLFYKSIITMLKDKMMKFIELSKMAVQSYNKIEEIEDSFII